MQLLRVALSGTGISKPCVNLTRCLQAARLADVEVERLVRSCGAHTLLEQVPATEQSMMQWQRKATGTNGDGSGSSANADVLSALHQLDRLAASPDGIPEYQHITLPRIRANVAKRVAQGLSKCYESLYEVISDQSKAGEIRAPSQLNALLGVQHADFG